MSTGTLSPFPLVRKGDRDHPVKTLQHLLGARGHSVAVDGIFGPKTDAAVRGFQQALHQDIPSVTVDGIVGPVTWRALVSGMLSF
jgi:peptidoglycan hydrolase-like protein with peptidoglycan-binding domain